MNEIVSMLLGLGIGIIIFFLAIEVFMIICMWKIYSKAGQPGWAVIVPIYNLLVMLKIVNKPAWWFALFLSPILGSIVAMASPIAGMIVLVLSVIVVFIFNIIIIHRLSLSFGKGAGFTVGILFLPFIFIPLLAFGANEYKKLEA